MGNGNVKFKSELSSLETCDTKLARVLLNKYLELDMEFCFTADDLQRLFRECEMGYGEDVVSAIMDCFPTLNAAQAKTINALDFIEGFAMLSKGSFDDKVNLMFDVFDFQKRAEITFDETTIMFICTSQGVRYLSGFPGEQNNSHDDKVTAMIRSDFGFACGEEKDIPKDHFLAWAKEKASRFSSLEQIIGLLQGTPLELVEPETKIPAEGETLIPQSDAAGSAEEQTKVEDGKTDAESENVPGASAEATTEPATQAEEQPTESEEKADIGQAEACEPEEAPEVAAEQGQEVTEEKTKSSTPAADDETKTAGEEATPDVEEAAPATENLAAATQEKEEEENDVPAFEDEQPPVAEGTGASSGDEPASEENLSAEDKSPATDESKVEGDSPETEQVSEAAK